MIRRTFTAAMRPGATPQTVTGYEFDAEGVTLCVHRSLAGCGDGWSVSEPVTGRKVLGFSESTQVEAIDAARRRVYVKGADALRRAIAAAAAA